MKKIATAHTSCGRKKICERKKFCNSKRNFANLAAQIWRKLTQKSAKNPRKGSKFLRFCVAIPPQIFATGNPSGGVELTHNFLKI